MLRVARDDGDQVARPVDRLTFNRGTRSGAGRRRPHLGALAPRRRRRVTVPERAAADSERVLGRGDRTTLVNRAGLGASYFSSGRTNEGIILLEQVLTDSERELGRA